VTSRDLVRQPFVLFEAGSNTRRAIDRYFADAKVNPQIVLETENVEIIKVLVGIGMGLTVIPFQAVEREVREGQLACTRISGVRLERETGWVFPKASRRQRILEELFLLMTQVRSRLKLESARTLDEAPAGSG
jgi:DNA-binding transcriptional LysR family regulator